MIDYYENAVWLDHNKNKSPHLHQIERSNFLGFKTISKHNEVQNPWPIFFDTPCFFLGPQKCKNIKVLKVNQFHLPKEQFTLI